MTTVQIKSLSVNKCWQGRRFKSPEYKAFEEELLWKLPPLEVPEGDIEVNFLFGVSNKLSDLDNFLKPILDILQKKYGFNDRSIYRIVAEKILVNKGQEFLTFSFFKHGQQTN